VSICLAKSTAPQTYSIDLQVPGHDLWRAVLESPVEGATPEQFDESKVAAIAGVIATVRLALRRWCAGRDTVGGFRRQGCCRAQRHLEPQRQRLGL